MAGLTKRHEIALTMVAAFGDRYDVMHLLNRGHTSFLKAPLTKRVLRYIAVSNAFPRSSVSPVDGWASPVLVVLAALSFLMHRAVLLVRQVGATGV